MSLGDDLRDLAGQAPPDRGRGGHFDRLAEAIRANPQAHIDALVGAGVLVKADPREALQSRFLYRVVQPHKHEWRVRRGTFTEPPELILICSCLQERTVPNRLPIEVPVA